MIIQDVFDMKLSLINNGNNAEKKSKLEHSSRDRSRKSSERAQEATRQLRGMVNSAARFRSPAAPLGILAQHNAGATPHSSNIMQQKASHNSPQLLTSRETLPMGSSKGGVYQQ